MKRNSGLTLIELMVVVGIVALLVALALPNYTAWVRKANRGDAQQALLNWANNQEIYRANNPQYATEAQLSKPAHPKFNFALSNRTASTFTLTATAIGDQMNDKEKGTTCTPLTLDQSGAKGPPDCWQ